MTVQVYRPSVCSIVQSDHGTYFTSANHRVHLLCTSNQRKGLGVSICQTNKICKESQTAQNRQLYGKTNTATCLGISANLKHIRAQNDKTCDISGDSSDSELSGGIQIDHNHRGQLERHSRGRMDG